MENRITEKVPYEDFKRIYRVFGEKPYEEKYTEEDYNKFRNLELDIKASCTTNDISTTTKTFASYPLLLITKNGKSVDCLLGYQSESDVIELLSKYNIIK